MGVSTAGRPGTANITGSKRKQSIKPSIEEAVIYHLLFM